MTSPYCARLSKNRTVLDFQVSDQVTAKSTEVNMENQNKNGTFNNGTSRWEGLWQAPSILGFPLPDVSPDAPGHTPPPAPRIPISLWFRNFPSVLEEAGLPAAQLSLFIWVIIGCLL